MDLVNSTMMNTSPPVSHRDNWLWSTDNLAGGLFQEDSPHSQSQADPAPRALVHQHSPASASDFMSPTVAPTVSTDPSPVGRCFLDSVVNLQPNETTTSCSSAISMILSQNRLGLSLAQLQERLKPGLLAETTPTVPMAECRVQNKVLFQVLAEIAG